MTTEPKTMAGGRLTKEQIVCLLKWTYNNYDSLTLIYSLRNHGNTALDFHKRCDLKGPTVTVIYDTNGNIYGGMTFEEFRSVLEYRDDPNALLFWLKKGGRDNCKMFRHAKNGYRALQNHPEFGPTFGGKHDLRTFRNKATKVKDMIGETYNTSYTMNNSCWIGQHFLPGFSEIISKQNMIQELEVYQLVEVDRKAELRLQELEQMRNDIALYAPLQLPYVRILLVGPVGAGKSSLINTIFSFFAGYRVNVVHTGGPNTKILTTKFKVYRPNKKEDEQTAKFHLCDTRGVDESSDMEQFEYIMNGNVPDGYLMPDGCPKPEEIEKFIKNPTENDKFQCLCVVLDGHKFETIDKQMLQKLLSVRRKAKGKEIPVLVAVTHLDIALPGLKHNPSLFLEDPEVVKMLSHVSREIGVAETFAFPVTCTASDREVSTDEQWLTAKFIRQMLRSSDDCLIAKR